MHHPAWRTCTSTIHILGILTRTCDTVSPSHAPLQGTVLPWTETGGGVPPCKFITLQLGRLAIKHVNWLHACLNHSRCAIKHPLDMTAQHAIACSPTLGCGCTHDHIRRQRVDRITPRYFTCFIGEHLISLSPNNDLQEKLDARMCVDKSWASACDQSEDGPRIGTRTCLHQ